MLTVGKKNKLVPFVMLALSVCLLLASGCARYARSVNTLYEPSATVGGGSGNLYIVIPENRTTPSADVKWTLGTVKDDDNRKIDEVSSPRSAAEIIQAAFVREFKRAGYTVIATTSRPADAQQVLDLTKAEIELEQVSDIVDLKARCRVIAGVDVFRDGQQLKRLQYEATTSRTDVRDRDLLAGKVLEDALQSLMQKALPELHGLFTSK